MSSLLFCFPSVERQFVRVLQVIFKKEVSETFFRCVKMGYEQDLAVIELNGLKIAEDRTFADCARHVFASILDLCLPYAATCKGEYHSLFQPDVPDTGTQVVLPVVMSPAVARSPRSSLRCSAHDQAVSNSLQFDLRMAWCMPSWHLLTAPSAVFNRSHVGAALHVLVRHNCCSCVCLAAWHTHYLAV